MKQIFISYSRKDRDFVVRLATELEIRLSEVNIFYDMLIQAGESWAETLSAKIEQADIVLAILSPDFLSSSWTAQELNVAFARQLKKQTRVIPVLIRPCNPTGILSQLAWVDFTEDFETALTRLLWGITGERPKAAKGKEPGAPVRAIDQTEVEKLHREAEAAVEIFKSRNVIASSDKEIKDHTGQSTDRKINCFIVMPFRDHDLQVVYEDFVRPTLENDCELNCERGDDVFGSNIIMEDIVNSINRSDVIIADLTGKNANVFL